MDSYSWHSKECIPQAFKAALWQGLNDLQQSRKYNAENNNACEEVSAGSSHRALRCHQKV